MSFNRNVAQLDGSNVVVAEAANGRLKLGSNKGNSAVFDGETDEVAIYDRVLSGYEIYALAQTAVHGAGTTEISVESFDPASGAAGSANWQPATVANPGVLLSTWSYTLPCVAEGFYQIRLRSSDASGNSQNGYVIWRGTIDTTPPQITFSGTHLGNGATAVTEYSFTMADFILDDTGFSHPCNSSDVITTTYTLANDPRDGLPYLAGSIICSK